MTAETTIPAGMKPWASDQKPNDIDTSEPVMFSGGRLAVPDDYDHPPLWRDIIAYTPRAPETREPVAGEGRDVKDRLANSMAAQRAIIDSPQYGTVEREAARMAYAVMKDFAAMLALARDPSTLDGGGGMHSDDRAVDLFAASMKTKLAIAREKGRGGWDDPAQCSVGYLQRLLLEHVTKGDPIDVANFCMMLHHYDASIARTPPAHPVGREAIARIIDPDAWHDTLPQDGCGEYWSMRRAKALAKATAILALTPPAPDVQTEIAEMQMAQLRDDQAKSRWIIVEEADRWVVHTHSADSVGPTSSYPSKRAAAARLLQLLHIGPVAPQSWPEEACIGSIDLEEGGRG